MGTDVSVFEDMVVSNTTGDTTVLTGLAHTHAVNWNFLRDKDAWFLIDGPEEVFKPKREKTFEDIVNEEVEKLRR